MINHIQMADAMVDATQVDATQYTLKRRNLTLGEEDFIKSEVVLDWNKRRGDKFLYYESQDHKFVIKVKSLRPYDMKRMTCDKMIDLLKKEVKENDQLKLIVKTDLSNLETGAPLTFEKTMTELTEDILGKLPLPFSRVKIYLHSDSDRFACFEVEDKAKMQYLPPHDFGAAYAPTPLYVTHIPPKTKTADSPFRPRRKLSKRLKKSSSKSAQKRRKSKKRSAKPRRR
jgi:hypothetical protein